MELNMRNYAEELEKRVEFIKNIVSAANAKGIVFGNSGGKDSALVGILCKKACENTVGVIMPCGSKRNYNEDMKDGHEVAQQFNIETRTVDLSGIKEDYTKVLGEGTMLNKDADINIAPRLRMTTLYAIATSENMLVSGTSNRSEIYMGYFTKWGDGACDFNPIADLTPTEIYEFLKFLGAPDSVITKAPSGGLFDGQTDEADMGVSYVAIDKFLLIGEARASEKSIIDKYHARTQHKRAMPLVYAQPEA